LPFPFLLGALLCMSAVLEESALPWGICAGWQQAGLQFTPLALAFTKAGERVCI